MKSRGSNLIVLEPSFMVTFKRASLVNLPHDLLSPLHRIQDRGNSRRDF
jgi:hypothetical protein